MRGQVSFIEILVTMSIFISFVGYFSFQLLNFYPVYLTEIRNERIRSEIYQLSELLINDPGQPINWQNALDGSVVRVGLSNENANRTNYLSSNKIANFNTSCKANYDGIKSKLGSQFDFSILMFKKPNNEQLIGCKPPSSRISVHAINATIRRIVYFGSGYGELIIQMW